MTSQKIFKNRKKIKNPKKGENPKILGRKILNGHKDMRFFAKRR